MIWANVTKFWQNFIAPQIFLGWYGYVHACPAFKKGDSSNINNYRPVSLLSNILKYLKYLIKYYLKKKLCIIDCIHF